MKEMPARFFVCSFLSNQYSTKMEASPEQHVFDVYAFQSVQIELGRGFFSSFFLFRERK